MFTNEIEHDHSITTVMDDTGSQEDVHLIVGDEGIHIRQWDEVLNDYNAVLLTHEMFDDLLTALHEGEGLFKIKD